MIQTILMYALTATSFTIGKAIYSYAQPMFFLGVRLLIAGGVLLGFCKYRYPECIRIHKKDYGKFAIVIGVYIYISFLFDLLALKEMSSFKAAFLYNLSPFIAAIFSYYWFNEHITFIKAIGLGIGILGFLPELINSSGGETSLIGFLSRAELLMLISVFVTVYGWVLVRSLVKEGYSPLLINGVGMVGGGALSLASSAMWESWQPFPVMHWWPFTYLTVLIVLMNDLGFYTLYAYYLRHYTATFLSLAGLASPLITAGLGWMFLGEHVSWTFFFSLGVVFIGLSIVYHEELRQGYIILNPKKKK